MHLLLLTWALLPIVLWRHAMNRPEHEQHNEPASGFPVQLKILLAIIGGGVLYLLLQVLGVF